MKHHWLFKFLAFVLAMLSGVMTVMGAYGIMLSEELSYVEVQSQNLNASAVCDAASVCARAVAGRYAQKRSGVSEAFFRQYIYWDYAAEGEVRYEYDYRIMDEAERTLENTRGASEDYRFEYTDSFFIVRSNTVEMPEMSYYPTYDEYMEFLGNSEDAVYLDENGVKFPELTYGTYAFAYGYENGKTYRIDYVGTDRFEVEICFTQEQINKILTWEEDVGISMITKNFRAYSQQAWLLLLGLGLLLMALSLVWLCVMAGRQPGSVEIRPGGLNRIPLDLYSVAAVTVLIGLTVLLGEILEDAIRLADALVIPWYLCVISAGAGAGLTIAMYLMAFAAQWKMEDSYWLKKSLCGRAWGLLAAGGRRALGWTRGLFRELPVIGRWLVALGGIGLVLAVTLYLAVGNSYLRWHWFFTLVLLAEVLACIGVTVYCVYAFGVLKRGAAEMAKGNLHHTVPQSSLCGPFREFAGELNSLSQVTREAAQQQMKSERMKTELITNISHDIKTPLTSIINYVDLLRRSDGEAQRAEYLEVLDRQSGRLKKLIEDLMEMSKASTGNIAVELAPADVDEAVKQALGEFADRMEQQGLSVLYRGPGGALTARCDGKLLWRVLSNLLNNVVKYAMPGTRVYADLTEQDGQAVLSLKNISAEPLNISADELAERFVRGDESRNTEGSGLGLNIARSLMEAQNGTLELTVDGDLFKAVLTLPVCS